MVKEREAFLGNVARVIDSLCILAAFFLSYFVSILVRDFFSLGEMAFAIAPDLQGLLFFSQKMSQFYFQASLFGWWCFPGKVLTKLSERDRYLKNSLLL